MNRYFECENCGQVVQRLEASRQVDCCESPQYREIDGPNPYGGWAIIDRGFEGKLAFRQTWNGKHTQDVLFEHAVTIDYDTLEGIAEKVAITDQTVCMVRDGNFQWVKKD